jgi:hypothetical protein
MNKLHNMPKRIGLLFALLCWLQADAQVQPASPLLEHFPRVMRKKVPRWVRNLNLYPNEFVKYQPRKELRFVSSMPVLKLNVAINKSVFTENGDSILIASQEFNKQILKSRRLKIMPRPLLVSAFYFDRACINAGLSRRITYVVKGRTCQLQTDSSFDDSSELDSAITSRLHLFDLLPHQFLSYDAATKAITLQNITPKCIKDRYYRADPENTPAIKVTYRVLFEIVQNSFPKFDAVGCGCTAPHGEYKVEITGLSLNHENLRDCYDAIYQAYRQGRYE